jgi:hypothetical protein
LNLLGVRQILSRWMKLLPKYKTMIKYRVIEEQILEEGLSYNDAITVMEILNEQGKVVRIEKYNLPARLGRDPDLH